MASDPRHRLGRRGEWAALFLLWFKGYRLRHRNWRCPLGELDLVMRHRRTIVFVEVKTRSSRDFGGAAQAVDRAKSRRLARVASAYLSRFSLWDRPTRFDVVTFERSRRFPGWRARHLRNTIRPDLGRSV